jgi:hypothetical protein
MYCTTVSNKTYGTLHCTTTRKFKMSFKGNVLYRLIYTLAYIVKALLRARLCQFGLFDELQEEDKPAEPCLSGDSVTRLSSQVYQE